MSLYRANLISTTKINGEAHTCTGGRAVTCRGQRVFVPSRFLISTEKINGPIRKAHSKKPTVWGWEGMRFWKALLKLTFRLLWYKFVNFGVHAAETIGLGFRV